MKKPLISTLIIIIVIVVVIVAWINYKHKGSSGAGQKSGIVTSTGYVAKPITNVPKDLLLYPGVSQAPTDSTASGQVAAFYVSDTPQQAVTYYQTTLTAKGWKASTPNVGKDSASITFTKDNNTLQVTATVAGFGSKVQLVYK